MRYLAITSILCLCISSTFATYGSDHHNNHNDHGPKNHYDSPKLKLNEPKIHLGSPKIILDRPSINVHSAERYHHSPLHEDEPIILENDKPLYIRKTLHGIPAGHSYHSVAPAYHSAGPVVVDSGYSHGRVLDIEAPIQVINHAPIVHERPILIRRPVIVSKGLETTQDHLEDIHYGHGLSHGYGHAVSYGHAIPVSKGLHERTVVYSARGIGGHGHIVPSYSAHGHGHLVPSYGGHGHGHVVPSYSAPILLSAGHSGLVHGGKGLHGAVLAHGGYNGGYLHGGLHGGALHGGLVHGGSSLKKY